jgi:hypothetical protein
VVFPGQPCKPCGGHGYLARNVEGRNRPQARTSLYEGGRVSSIYIGSLDTRPEYSMEFGKFDVENGCFDRSDGARSSISPQTLQSHHDRLNLRVD